MKNFIIERIDKDCDFQGFYVKYFNQNRTNLHHHSHNIQTVLVTNGRNKSFFSLKYARVILGIRKKIYPNSNCKYIIKYDR